MSNASRQIVNKAWNFAHVLRRRAVVHGLYGADHLSAVPENPKEGLIGDEQDACVVARCLAEMSGRGELGRYWNPPLSESKRAVAEREEWILDIC